MHLFETLSIHFAQKETFEHKKICCWSNKIPNHNQILFWRKLISCSQKKSQFCFYWTWKKKSLQALISFNRFCFIHLLFFSFSATLRNLWVAISFAFCEESFQRGKKSQYRFCSSKEKKTMQGNEGIYCVFSITFFW